METKEQETMMKTVEPQEEHEWLQRLVGEWTLEADGTTDPGASSPSGWTETGRSLHGLWVVLEGQGEMPGGGPATTVMTLGYDPQRQRYVGTWIGSMMTHLWLYEGTLDPAGGVLTLDSEGPDFTTEGKMAKYKDVITFESDDRRALTSHVQGEDGEWREFAAHYQRKR